MCVNQRKTKTDTKSTLKLLNKVFSNLTAFFSTQSHPIGYAFSPILIKISAPLHKRFFWFLATVMQASYLVNSNDTIQEIVNFNLIVAQLIDLFSYEHLLDSRDTNF